MNENERLWGYLREIEHYCNGTMPFGMAVCEYISAVRRLEERAESSNAEDARTREEGPGINELTLAECALIALTDQCCGKCHWGSPDDCLCRDRLWPAIEAIRKRLIRAGK